MQLQMTEVLNSQSDSIVVVELAPQRTKQSQSKEELDVEDMKEEEVECNVQFLNSKSVELFGFDMLNTESSH